MSENLIPYERIRTLLYLSKFKKRRVWIVLCAPEQTYDKAQIINGVVDSIYNGTKPRAEDMTIENFCIGGRFRLADNNQEQESIDLLDALDKGDYDNFNKALDKSEKSQIYEMAQIRAVSLMPISMPDEIKEPLFTEYDENTLVALEHFHWLSTKMMLPSYSFLPSIRLLDDHYYKVLAKL